MLLSYLMTLFLKINFFQTIVSGTLIKCQTVLIQVRIDLLLVLTLVQTVCKGYQQRRKAAVSKERFIRINLSAVKE